jgi:hypothetical protein
MQPSQAVPAAHHHTSGIGPVLKGIADEICATLARLIAYLCTLALLFILRVYLWDQPDMHADGPAWPDWTAMARPLPAFASNQYDLSYKTESYQIFRRPEGGRKDVLRWNAENGQPVARLAIYGPGGQFEPLVVTETTGMIDSKFGSVTLVRRAGDGCLGFLKTIDQQALRLAGFVCQGAIVPARGAAISRMLNRLSLISAGNDASLAELFARAEMKRADCRADG